MNHIDKTDAEIASLAEKSKRLRIAIASLLAFFSFIIFQIRDVFYDRFYIAGIAIPTLMIGLSGFQFLMLYLSGDFGGRHTSSGFRPPLAQGNVESSLLDLQNRLDALEGSTKSSTGNVSAAEVAALILPSINQQLGQVFEAQYEQKSAREKAARLIDRRFDAAVTRLENEISEQSRKGNVNLAIGVVTTVIAIMLLAYMVLAQPVDISGWPQIATHYIPRISLAVFIEIFSFFFLKLYKSTLEEARRYNDDLSRLTLQWVALQTGWFAEKDGETLALAKELLGLTKPAKAIVTEPSSSIASDKLVQAMLKAISSELGDKLKKEEKAKKNSKESDQDDD